MGAIRVKRARRRDREPCTAPDCVEPRINAICVYCAHHATAVMNFYGFPDCSIAVLAALMHELTGQRDQVATLHGSPLAPLEEVLATEVLEDDRERMRETIAGDAGVPVAAIFEED